MPLPDMHRPCSAPERAGNGALPPTDGWTPKTVGDALVAALEWAQGHGGPVGPRGYKTAALTYVATLDDHLAEGWGLPEVAEDGRPDDDRPLRLMLPPAVVSRHRAALEWPARFLCPDHVGSARMVGLWAACKAGRRSFDGAVKERGVARSHAYRLRDRGLMLMAVGLDRERVPLA